MVMPPLSSMPADSLILEVTYAVFKFVKLVGIESVTMSYCSRGKELGIVDKKVITSRYN